MTEKAVSPLRQRMIEDMLIRQFAPKTQACHIRMVGDFTVFLGSAPERALAEDLRRHQLHLASTGATANSINRAGAWFFLSPNARAASSIARR